jgi:hypothetical protein
VSKTLFRSNKLPWLFEMTVLIWNGDWVPRIWSRGLSIFQSSRQTFHRQALQRLKFPQTSSFTHLESELEGKLLDGSNS